MKTLTLICFFLISLNLNAQKGKLYLSNWNENGTEATNIPSEKYSFSRKANLYYYISNDNANIYLGMKTDDREAQIRILKQGLTVWVNMDSKLAKKMGIHFPIGSQNSEGHKRSNIPDENLKSEVNLVTQLSLANKIELIGFTNEELRRFPSENPDNFRGSVSFDNTGTLHYKMTMPIAKLPLRNSKDGKGAMPFIFGIEYGPQSEQKAFPQILFWIKNIKLATDR
jgi:hypothetical protein